MTEYVHDRSGYSQTDPVEGSGTHTAAAAELHRNRGCGDHLPATVFLSQLSVTSTICTGTGELVTSATQVLLLASDATTQR